MLPEVHHAQWEARWVPGLFRTVPWFQHASQFLVICSLLLANYFGSIWFKGNMVEYPVTGSIGVALAQSLPTAPEEAELATGTDPGAGIFEERLTAPPKPVKPREAPPVLRSVPNASGRVALTFDDGPYPYWTEIYLKVLEVYQAPASFFVIGRQAEAYPELLRQVVAAGHEVGSHSYAHRRMGELPEEEAGRDIRSSAEAIQKVTGQTVQYFRPPYGNYNRKVVDRAWQEGLRTVTWSVDPRDWNGPGYKELARRVVEKAREGDIILLHEGKQETLIALGIIINGLREKGFQLVTISDLLAAGETADKPDDFRAASSEVPPEPAPGDGTADTRDPRLFR